MIRAFPRLLVAAALMSTCWACGDSMDTAAPGNPDAGTNPDAGLTPDTTQPTIYYVVRHAERDIGDDPPLNEEGFERAERRADALEQAGIDEIVTTRFLRGQQTGQPLSDRTGVPIAIAPFEWTSWPEFALDVSAWQLEREVPGTTYLMIGHSSTYNTTLLTELGAPPSEEPLAERFQDLVIMIREPDGAVRLSVLQYGGESSLDPAL